MPESGVGRIADLHLRGVDRLLPARVYWPESPATPPALVVHTGRLSGAAELCRAGYIVLTVETEADDDVRRIVEWAAAHGPELGAARCFVAIDSAAIDCGAIDNEREIR